jgi:hypothetical protein
MRPVMVLAGVLILAACEPAGTVEPVVTDVAAVTTVAFTDGGAAVTLTEGASISLPGAVRVPDGITLPDPSVGYRSSDTTRVRVSDSGIVSAISPGSAELTVFSRQYPSKTATRSVFVAPGRSDIRIEPAVIELGVGKFSPFKVIISRNGVEVMRSFTATSANRCIAGNTTAVAIGVRPGETDILFREVGGAEATLHVRVTGEDRGSICKPY